MTQHDLLYPKLRYFFSAYFPYDWKSLYNWQNEKPSFQIVVRDFKANNSQATVAQATQELEKFLAQELTEGELHEIAVQQLGANINPPGLGLTCEQWLRTVLTILKETS